MSKTVNEVKLEIASMVKKSKKNKPIKSFSRSEFDKLANAWMNDMNYEMVTVSKEDDKIVEKVCNPVRDFREKMIYPVLVEAGVPKEDASKLANEYEWKNSQTAAMFNVVTDIQHQYLDAGKKITLPARKDFVGSIQYNEVEAYEGEKEYTNPQTNTKIKRKEKRGSHKILAKSSSCPKWLIEACK